MLDRFEFLFSEAWVALRRNSFMTFAAVSTVAVALFLLGGMLYVYMRAVAFAETVPGRFDMRVFLKDGTDQKTISATAEAIRKIPGVASVAWIPRDNAWRRWLEEHPDTPKLEIENPFPDAFKVTMGDLEAESRVSEAIQRLPAVQEEKGVQYLRDELQMIYDGLDMIRLLGSILGGILFITGGILIYNAIRLAILSRRLEIRIMQLVGASRLTIQIPFLVEGVLQGIVGGAFAAMLLFFSQQGLERYLKQNVDPTMQLQSFPLLLALVVLGIFGGAYGTLCSALAMRAPLRFR